MTWRAVSANGPTPLSSWLSDKRMFLTGTLWAGMPATQRQGLTLNNFSAQPEQFLTQNTP